MSEEDKRKDEIIQRIQKREKERKEKQEERKAISKQETEQEDSVKFWKDFSDLKNSIVISNENVEGATQIVQELQQMLNRSIHFLIPYDIRQADQTIKNIENEIEQIKKTETEKKKFTFKKKIQTPKTPNTTPVTPISESIVMPSLQSLINVKPKTFDSINEKKVIEPVDYTREYNKLEVNPDDDLVISNCQNAMICFCCVSGAAYIKNLVNCTVLMGPVSGSAFLQNCTNCTIMIAARQVRIHTSTNCDFYLYTRSDPIIEHCSDIRVAPYDFTYDHIDKHFTMAQFDASKNQDWCKVKDFNWLKQEQSPNWSILPESDRKQYTYPFQ
jgi:hypothetical protein